jgi:hypothetical protein
VLVFIWGGGPPSPIWAQFTATLFVSGLASFLTWFIKTVLEIARLLRS